MLVMECELQSSMGWCWWCSVLYCLHVGYQGMDVVQNQQSANFVRSYGEAVERVVATHFTGETI